MKNFFKSIIFLIILILSFQYYEQKIFKKFDVAVNYAYNNLPQNSIDLLFVGSSHSYCTFNTRLFDHYLKCNSLNLGTDAQSLSVTYSAILEILKKQNPKVIILEIYPIGRDSSIIAIRPFLDTMAFSLNKFRLIKNSLPISEWGNHFFNTIYYHSRWKEFNNLRKLEDKGYNNYGGRLENKGFWGYAMDFIRTFLTYDIYEQTYDSIPNNSSMISEDYLKLLENLFKMCQKKRIKVILTSPPVIDNPDILSILYNPSLKELMNKYDIDSIDFNDCKIKYEKIDFLDNGHLSLAGADKISFKMAEYLKEYYTILLNTEKYKKYESENRSPEYYFYSENTKVDDNFQTFNLELELEKGVVINSLSIYKKDDDNFDLFFCIDENKSSDEIYQVALNKNEVNLNLDKFQLNFITTKDDKEEYPKYYVRQIKNKKYIYKKNVKIPQDSKYYF